MSISRDEIKQVIIEECEDTKRSTKLWSVLHYGLLFSATALSAAAAGVLNLTTLFALSEGARHDYATLFSTVATVFGGIATAGNFASKWSASRMARSGLEQLRYLMLDDACDLVPVQQRLIQIRRDKDVAFTQQVGRTSTQPQTAGESGQQSQTRGKMEQPVAVGRPQQKGLGSSGVSLKSRGMGGEQPQDLAVRVTQHPADEKQGELQAVGSAKPPSATA